MQVEFTALAGSGEQHVGEVRRGEGGNRQFSAPGLFAAFSSGLIFGSLLIWWYAWRRISGVRKVAAVQMDVMATVLHELRTVTSAILTAAENVRDGLVKEDCLREQGIIITSQAERLMTVVDHVMLYADAAHCTRGNDLREVNVADVIEDALRCVSFLLEKERFTVQREIEPEMPPVTGNLGMLSQCLQNFIVNAVKYGRERHWIGIVAQICAASGVRQKEIQISVYDRGLGIHKADRKHIFEPYYRGLRSTDSSFGGAGLGLSIAKHEAEACGGSISFASEEGVGSVFTLHLPLQEDKADRPFHEK